MSGSGREALTITIVADDVGATAAIGLLAAVMVRIEAVGFARLPPDLRLLAARLIDHGPVEGGFVRLAPAEPALTDGRLTIEVTATERLHRLADGLAELPL